MRACIKCSGFTYSRGFWGELWWGYLYFYRYPSKRGIMREENEPHPSNEIIRQIKRKA